MRYITFILSIYILALTAFPCQDKPNDDAIQNSQITQTTNNASSQCDFDCCSPFCVCSCCVSPVIPQIVLFSLHIPTVTHFSFTEYASVSISSLPVAIWQPPKLG